MGLKFYKPTPKGNGHACHFTFKSTIDTVGENGEVTSQGDKAVFLEFIKQSGWNDKSKTGSFKGGAKANVKFSKEEVCSMILAMRNGEKAFPHPYKEGQFGAFHNSEHGSTLIKFEPYANKGFSLSVSKTPKEGEKLSFLIGLTFAEMLLLEEYFKFALNHFFTSFYSEDKKIRDASFKKFKESKVKKVVAGEPLGEEVSEEEIPF